MRARGFVERAGMLMCGALPPAEIAQLRQVMAFSHAEEQMLVGWTTPPGWDAVGADDAPPDRGNFLAKVDRRPGIPFRVMLTHTELALNDTNKR